MSDGSPTPAASPSRFWESLPAFPGIAERPDPYLYGTKHSANADHPGYAPEFLFVFVHGVLATHESTWLSTTRDGTYDFPRELLSQLGIDVNVINFRYPSRWLEQGSVNRAVVALETRLANNFTDARHIFFFAHSNGGIVVKRYLDTQFNLSRQQLDRVVDPPATGVDAAAAAHKPWWRLCASRAALPSGDDAAKPADTAWGRTRAVINFDVPHFGGAYYLTTVGAGVSALACPFATAWQKLRELRESRFGVPWDGQVLGHNRIFLDLFPLNPLLHLLHARHLRQWNEMAARHYPRPTIRDILAERDGVIRPPGRLDPAQDGNARPVQKDASGRLYRRLDGNHSTVKIGGWVRAGSVFRGFDARLPAGYVLSPLTKLLTADGHPPVCGWLDGLRDRRSIITAEATLRLLLTTRGARVDRLIGSAHPDTGWTEDGHPVQSQASLLASVEQQLRDSCPRVHVVGPAGVGKSTVTRMLVRKLCAEFLADVFVTNRPLPLFFQLKEYEVPEGRAAALRGAPNDARGEALWAFWVAEWCRKANQFHCRDDKGPFCADWIRARLRDPARKEWKTVVVVDSIDDFLTKHPYLSLGHVRDALKVPGEWGGPDAGVAVVAVTRITLDDPVGPVQTLRRLGPISLLGENQALSLLGDMTPGDCRTAFPTVGRVLDYPRQSVPDDVRKLLLKPLFAKFFENSSSDPATLAGALRDRGTTFLSAISELLKQSGLLRAQPGAAPTVDTSDAKSWLAALAIINQCMFNQNRTAITEADILAAAGAAGAEWDGSANAPLAHGARLLHDDTLRRALLDRTILRTNYAGRTATVEYSIYHREFEDFLSAWHLAECVRYQRFGNIERRGHTVSIFTLAGELLVRPAQGREAFGVNRALSAALAQAAQQKRWVVFGNIVALIGNSTVPLLDGAAHALLEALWRLPPEAGAGADERLQWREFATIRLIMFSTLCRRAMKALNEDSSGPILLNALTDPTADHTLWKFLDRSTEVGLDSVTRSLLYSYLVEYGRRDPRIGEQLREVPAGPVPTEEDVVAILAPAELRTGGAADVRVRFFSYQRGFLTTARAVDRRGETITGADRLINALHYALCLATVARKGLLSDELVNDPAEGIGPVAGNDSAVAELVKTRGDAHLLALFQKVRDVLGSPATPEGRNE